MKQIILLLPILIIFVSCATYKTVAPDSQANIVEYVDSIEHEKCVSIPRVYSGLAYTYCILSGAVKLKSMHYQLPLVPLDLVADTALLPYTIYKQSVDGNLQIKKTGR